jgi:hypothetical protein
MVGELLARLGSEQRLVRLVPGGVAGRPTFTGHRHQSYSLRSRLVHGVILPRAARGLLDWSMEKLSPSSSVPMSTLLRFERSEGVARQSTLAAIRAALEAAGVEFMLDNGGIGVR